MADYSKIISRLTVEQKASIVTSVDGWSKIVAGGVEASALTVSDGAFGVKVAEALKMSGAPTTRFPSPLNVARSWNLKTAARVADVIASEARALGVNTLLTPEGGTLGFDSRADNGRRLSEDAYLSGKMLSAYVEGYRHSGALGCVKMTDATAKGISDEKEYREKALQPYEMAIKEGNAQFVRLPSGSIGGTASCESRHLVRGILQTEWGFDGTIVCDVRGGENLTKAFAVGASIINSSVPTNEAKRIANAVHNHKRILEEIQNGIQQPTALASAMNAGTAISEELLDDALERIFTTLAEYGVDEPEASDSYSAYPFNHPVMFDEQKNSVVAYEAALETITLLKNDGVLPIAEGKRVAFVGEYAFLPFGTCADDGFVALDNEITVKMLSTSGIDTVGCSKGYARSANAFEVAALLGNAKELCNDADIVVAYVGNLAENGSGVPEYQVRFLRELRQSSSAKLVAVFVGNSLGDMSWNDLCDAVVLAGDAGQGGAKAVLRVLSGAYCPSGKLTETVFDSNGCEKYPFGHGLSYTSFEYSELKVSNKGVGFKITNVGDVAGALTAQVYVGKESSRVSPKRALRGFEKVYLQAGESKYVEIAFDSKAFRYYNTATHSWEIEGGAYEIFVGSSASDVRLSGEISVASSGAEIPEATVEEVESAEPQAASVPEAPSFSMGKLIGLIGAIAGVAILAMLYFAFFREVIFDVFSVRIKDEFTWDVFFSAAFAIGMAAVISALVIELKKSNIGSVIVAENKHVGFAFGQTEYKQDTVYANDWKNLFDEEETAVVERLFEEEPTEVVEEKEEEVIAPSECALVRYSSFDTLEAGIGAIGAAFCKYAAEKHIVVSNEELIELFAAIAATRLTAIRCSNAEGALRVVESLGEFLNADVSFVGTESLADGVAAAANVAAAQTDKINITVVHGGETEDIRELLGELTAYTGNSPDTQEIKLGDTVVALPSNMWFAVLIPDDRATEAGNACVIRLHANADDMLDIDTAMAQDYENEFVYAYTMSMTTLSDLIERGRETYYLSEKYWRKIDKLTEHINVSVPFAISNKTANAMERFVAVCIGNGMEQSDVMDYVLAALVLSVLSAKDASKLDGDETLTEFMDALFGADKDDRSREAVRLKGIK